MPIKLPTFGATCWCANSIGQCRRVGRRGEWSQDLDQTDNRVDKHSALSREPSEVGQPVLVILDRLNELVTNQFAQYRHDVVASPGPRRIDLPLLEGAEGALQEGNQHVCVDAAV